MADFTEQTPARPGAALLARFPVGAKELRAVIEREHSARGGDMGCSWWRIVRDAYEGTGGFARSLAVASTGDARPGNYERGATPRRRSTYLHPFARETDESFANRADRSTYTNYVAPVVDVYHGHITRHRAQRETTHSDIASWWQSVDAAGHDIAEFSSIVAKRAQLYGWCAVLVDRETTLSTTLRTVATILEPEEIRDWAFARDGALDWVKIVSDWTDVDPTTGVETHVTECTLWTRTEWARLRLEKHGSETDDRVTVTDSGAHDIGRVPVAVLRYSDSVRAQQLFGVSQVFRVVPLVVALFNVDSELTDHLAKVNFAFLAVQSDDPSALKDLRLGSNGGMTYPSGVNAPEYVAPPESVALQYALRADSLVRSIYAASNLERPDAQASGGDAASGVAKAYDFAQTDAALQGFARQLTAWEYELVALHAGWARADVAKVVAATTIAYPKRFDARGIADDLGAHFVVLDEKVRQQFPPEVLRQARLSIARLMFPEAPDATLALIAAQVDKMFADEVTALNADRGATSTGLFGYDIESGVLTVDELRQSKGFPPRGDAAGALSTLEYKLLIEARVEAEKARLAAERKAADDAEVEDALNALPKTGADPNTLKMSGGA